MRILIVEDEARLAETLRQLMEDQRYQADTVGDGEDGVDYGLTGQYDLIILDVMLPKVDGFEVARRLRAAHISTPILMLTARDDVSDKIGGLDCGADDYMTKPFDSGELMARVRALTRRQGEVMGDVLKVSGLSLECSSRLLRVGERSVRLGFKEFEVMRLLMVNSRSVVSKETQIAFCDRSWEQASLWRLVINSLLIGAGALVVFFLISLFLSHLALKPVEEAWRQQRQFVADASHELKTPLTVILANTGIVEGHSGDTVASQAKWISYIREEAQRMKGLVEDMLFLARHDDARQPAKFQPCSLSDLVTGCVLRFESVAFEAGVELESDIQPGLTLQGDADCLERLVMILLDNGVKYAGEPGRVERTLRRRQERPVLAVTNTGPPIPPEHLEHLFQRFYRVDGSRSRKEGGYGLGLAIAQTIVQDHRGQIEVTSGERKGTCFTVTLPRVRIPSKK